MFSVPYGFGLVDEGESLHNAQRIISGDMPYRDFFAVFPPFDNYYYAIIMKIFGNSVLVPRIISALIFSGAVGILYLISGPVSALLLIFSDVSTDRLFFYTPIFLAIYLFIKNKHLFISGLLLGSISWFRMDIPATFVIAMFVIGTFFNKKIKPLFVLMLGYVLPMLALLIWMYHFKVLSLFYRQAIVQALQVTKLMDLSILNPIQIVSLPLTLRSAYIAFTNLYFYLLIAVWGVGIFWAIKKKVTSALIFLISGALAFPYIMGRTDIGHMVKGGMFVFVILGLWAKESNKWLRLPSITISIALVIAGIVQTGWLVKFNDTKVNIKNNTLRLNKNYVLGTTLPSAQTLKQSVEYLQTESEDQSVLVVPYMAGLYFLADRSSPSRYNNILGGEIATFDEQREFIVQVEKKAVNIVIYDPKYNYNSPGFELRTYNPLIHEYIMNTYTVINTTSEGWLFMKRKV